MKQWENIPYFKTIKKSTPYTHVSIIISARNEADNIEQTLRSLVHQDYPQASLEIVVIDDFSEDNTLSILKSWHEKHPNIKVIALADILSRETVFSAKKTAITKGIEAAKGTWIITTDADCTFPRSWVRSIMAYQAETQADMIAAPVVFSPSRNLSERFQALDFVGMMAVTGAGIASQKYFMCNGANLAYSKQLFNTLGGFEGNEHRASGDDLFLMDKAAKAPQFKIDFLKSLEATVRTLPQENWQKFWNQRMRWATKNSAYQHKTIIYVAAIVLFYCLGIIFSLGLGLLCLERIPILIATAALLLKAIVDYIFLRKMAIFFRQKELMKIYLWSIPLHILYIAIIGTVGNFRKKYLWKGRKVS